MALISLFTAGRSGGHFSLPGKFLFDRWKLQVEKNEGFIFTPQASLVSEKISYFEGNFYFR